MIRMSCKTVTRMDVQRLQRVLDHVDANLERHVSLDELAAIACLSRFRWSISAMALNLFPVM